MQTATNTTMLIFDKTNWNWSNNMQYNLMYLRMQQNHFNDLLKEKGVVFLNEVLDALGFPRTQTGQVTGWAVQRENRNYIEFELQQLADGTIRIYLDVDGNVLDQLAA